MTSPSKRALDAIERELRKLPPGTQRAAGGGTYMRLDGEGRRRFQFRLRDTKGHPGSTYDSWEEAQAERAIALAELEAARNGCGDIGLAAYKYRRMKLSDYAKEWWQSVVIDLDVLTQHDYKRALTRDVLPLIGEVTLGQFDSAPMLVDNFKKMLVAHKTYPTGHARAGQLPRASCDHALKVASSICQHALRREIIKRNPFVGIDRFGQQRTPNTNGGRSSYRRIKPSEIMHPRTVSLAAAGIRGTWRQVEERRGVLELLGFGGLRPSEICAARHSWWRDAHGPKRFMTVSSAIKNVAGQLHEGEPKTGTRDIYLFDALAEQLERIYQAQGYPSLDSRIAPSTTGTVQDWGNWRERYWYQALFRGGLAQASGATAPGAFDPYLLRHILAGTMTHALRPRNEGGSYSRYEVAAQLGHSAQTLDRVYADVPRDLHNISGMTMDEIIRASRREVWGPMPGDADYREEWLTMSEAEALTGISSKSLTARIYRGSLPGRDRGARKVVSRFSLMWCGFLPARGIGASMARRSA